MAKGPTFKTPNIITFYSILVSLTDQVVKLANSGRIPLDGTDVFLLPLAWFNMTKIPHNCVTSVAYWPLTHEFSVCMNNFCSEFGIFVSENEREINGHIPGCTCPFQSDGVGYFLPTICTYV